MTPMILVLGRTVAAGRAGRHEAVSAGIRYLDALRRAGAEGVVAAPRSMNPDEADGLLAGFDGLLVIGGQDVDPALYGQEPVAETYGVRPVEDDFEMALLRAAVGHEVPTLAICRGMQALNVALGGSLNQHAGGGELDHIGPGFPHRPPHTLGPVIPVALTPGSRVANAIGSSSTDGTHLHHQTIDRVGAGLAVTALTDDGTIEAIEHERGWVVGVQWHPEDTAGDDAEQQRLFDAFVEECRRVTQAASRSTSMAAKSSVR